jgi:hypothetical protein
LSKYAHLFEVRKRMLEEEAESPATETSLVNAPSETSQVVETSLTPETSLVIETPQTLAEYAETLDYRAGQVRFNRDYFDRIISRLKGDVQLLYFHVIRYREGDSNHTVVLNWPLLERRTGKSQSTLFRASRTLADEGLAFREEHQTGRGKFQGFRFRIVLPTSLVSQNSQVTRTSLVSQTNSNSKELLKDNKKDFSRCPDCAGTGMFYPEGFDKGVARCSHRRLSKTS